MTKELDITLVGARTPDGEIAIKDLVAITSALQELATRIGRDVVNSAGPGRVKQFMEESTQLRLRGVTSGSTVLALSKGPTDKLDVDLPEQEQADTRFWELVSAVAEDQRPAWVSDLIAESAAKFVDAVQSAAPTVRLSSPGRRDISIASERVHAETWISPRQRTDTEMTANGRLEKVDLRSHEFRVRDDVGQAVDLTHVENDGTAARLVGKWVVARGSAVLAGSGRLVSLDRATVDAVEDPATPYLVDDVSTLADILASAPGPDPNGGIELTDDEFASFLAAARS